MRDGCSTVHHDDKRSFAAEEVDKELEKGIEGKGFVNITEGTNPESGFKGHETRP